MHARGRSDALVMTDERRWDEWARAHCGRENVRKLEAGEGQEERELKTSIFAWVRVANMCQGSCIPAKALHSKHGYKRGLILVASRKPLPGTCAQIAPVRQNARLRYPLRAWRPCLRVVTLETALLSLRSYGCCPLPWPSSSDGLDAATLMLQP